MDDLDDLLARRDRTDDLVPDGALGQPVDEILGDRQRNVRLQQRDTHLAHRRTHVEFGQRAAAAELVEHAGEAICETVEQGVEPPNSKAPACEPSLTGVHPRALCLPPGGRRRLRQVGPWVKAGSYRPPMRYRTPFSRSAQAIAEPSRKIGW